MRNLLILLSCGPHNHGKVLTEWKPTAPVEHRAPPQGTVVGEVTVEPWRLALYSHDSMGLGHVRRNLALAHALTNQLPGLTGRTVTGVLITGTSLAPSFTAPAGRVSR